ncbi:hypothetical protein M422DRAFT_263024 [Sphaerobolus stellatus SS14]|uniref:Uncharacterized protein n=1 Tax=Sphaerobolus stellatus (strain SS14) TaxID=990650 RepID=A0A0C9VBZ0_SPHS4|nr:hypothetical protein M422DRAFT_263024 [Sphaerobolus stellatus SS14]
MFDPVAEEAESSKQEVIIQHFARLLAARWRCNLPDHDICLSTLSQEELEQWIDELCQGKALVEPPPAWLLHNANIQDDADATSLYSHASSESAMGLGYYAGKGLVRMGKPL